MSKDGFDFHELRQFRDDFQTVSTLFDAWLMGFLLNEGLRFIARVKPRTPVDTGDLRNHWSISSISRLGDELFVWLINPMYYATFVEYGHAKPYKSGATEGSPDWVDGYFMMTVSIDFIRRNMPRRFDSEFAKFVESILGVK